MFQSLGSPNPFHLSHESQKRSNLLRQWGLGRSCSLNGRNNIANNLFQREIHGTSLHRLNNPFGNNGCPGRLRMPVEEIIPASALEAGNIFMGFTNCGRYLLSYTCRPSEHFGASVFDSDASYMYNLHIWLFTPYSKLRKVSQVCLFDNNGVYDNNLLIDISQWDMDDSHVLITGHSVNPDSECNHTFYTTITTIPDAKNCGNCVYMHDDELEDEIASNSRLRTNCILHGLTLHIKYDHVPPYPKFNPDVQLRFKDTVLLNTGNVIHTVSFKLIRPSVGKIDTVVVPAAAPSIVSTSRVPLQCDIWLKIPNANIGALASMKGVTRELTNDGDENIISLNGLEFLLSLFPCSSTSTKLCNDPVETHSMTSRRFSQSSTDSELFSPKSYFSCDCGPPMSPPFLNKPRSPRQGHTENKNNEQPSDSTVSPSKLMLPPQERKFFKRRLSSQSLGTNVGNIATVQHSSASISSSSTALNDNNKGREEATSTSVSSNSKSNQQNQSAFDVFEMRFEDTAVERHLSSFKTFRKRRLADKKYEFNDADLAAENIVPLKMTRRKSKLSQLQGNVNANPRSPRNENENTTSGNESPRAAYSELSHPRSPRAYVMSPGMSPNYSDSAVSDVLRPLNNNLKVKVPALSPNNNGNNTVGDAELQKMKDDDLKDFKDHTSQITRGCQNKRFNSDIPSHPHEKPTISIPINCIAKVMRSYIQREDDNLSVITDIEDELCQGYPFPVALPLEVHGAGYQQLQMISNSKADKFHMPVVQVLQRTLDIEMLCNEVANLICLASDKHYCSCLDFDLSFVDTNPDRGTVTAIVVMLLQATNLRAKSRNGEKASSSLDPRKKYEVLFACEWTPVEEHCRVLYKSNLRELETVPDPWHPTETMESIIKSHLKTSSSRKTLSNALAVHDWQSLDELTDAYGIVTLIKDEASTKTERRLNDNDSIVSGNNIDLASSISTVTDSDEDWGM